MRHHAQQRCYWAFTSPGLPPSQSIQEAVARARRAAVARAAVAANARAVAAQDDGPLPSPPSSPPWGDPDALDAIASAMRALIYATDEVPTAALSDWASRWASPDSATRAIASSQHLPVQRALVRLCTSVGIRSTHTPARSAALAAFLFESRPGDYASDREAWEAHSLPRSTYKQVKFKLTEAGVTDALIVASAAAGFRFVATPIAR